MHRAEQIERAIQFVAAIEKNLGKDIPFDLRNTIAATFLDYLCADCGHEVTGRREI